MVPAWLDHQSAFTFWEISCRVADKNKKGLREPIQTLEGSHIIQSTFTSQGCVKANNVCIASLNCLLDGGFKSATFRRHWAQKNKRTKEVSQLILTVFFYCLCRNQRIWRGSLPFFTNASDVLSDPQSWVNSVLFLVFSKKYATVNRTLAF